MIQKVKILKFHPLAWLRPCLPQHHVPPGKVWAQTSKTVCRTRCSSAALGLLMWNPIVSGSTDLWQHVWMYYSKAAEVRAAGGWTQDYRQTALYILTKKSEHMAFKVAKKQKYTDGKNNNSFFFSSSVWWHIMQQIETWTQSTELSPGLEWKLLKKKKKTEIKDGVWPLQGHACCTSSRHSACIRSLRCIFFYYCCHVHSAPWGSGSPSPSSSFSSRPSSQKKKKGAGGPSSDIKHAVN